MNEHVLHWQEKIDALEVRERLLLLLAVLAVLYLFWHSFIQEPLNKQQDKYNKSIKLSEVKYQALTKEEEALAVLSGIDPDAAKKRRAEALTSEIHNLDANLSALSNELVEADSLPQILQDVLEQSTDLNLLKIQMLPVELLDLDSVNVSASAIGNGVFKHSVLLQLEGEYFQLLNYLQALEKLEWRVYWDQMDYLVVSYPRAVIEVRVYTLSAEEGSIGV